MGDNTINNINSTLNNQNFNNSLLSNLTSNQSVIVDNNSKLLFLGIIFILLILLIISLFILYFLFKKRKKINSVSNNNMVLNKIVLKNPNNSFSLNIVNPKDFQQLQNTSNVSIAGIQQNNNVLNEIKSENLKDEIEKIKNATVISGSSGRRRGGKRNRLKNSSNDAEKKENNILGENKEMSFDSKNIILNEEKKDKKPDINTQKLEQEIKEQIKKYVVEENNI